MAVVQVHYLFLCPRRGRCVKGEGVNKYQFQGELRVMRGFARHIITSSRVRVEEERGAFVCETTRVKCCKAAAAGSQVHIRGCCEGGSASGIDARIMRGCAPLQKGVFLSCN